MRFFKVKDTKISFISLCALVDTSINCLYLLLQYILLYTILTGCIRYCYFSLFLFYLFFLFFSFSLLFLFIFCYFILLSFYFIIITLFYYYHFFYQRWLSCVSVDHNTTSASVSSPISSDEES